MSAQSVPTLDKPARLRVLEGRAPVIRGTLTWVVMLLTVIALGAIITNLVLVIYGYSLYRALVHKPPIVVEVSEGGSVIRDPATLQSGPRDVQILRRAWDIVRLTVGADSTNVRAFFAEAKAMMTPHMREAFERELEPSAKQIEDLQIYRTIEADPADVRLMTAADVPASEAGSVDRYHVLISGRVKTYRLGTSEPIMAGSFSYRVRLVPTEVTLQNAAGLLVDSTQPWTKPVKEEADATAPQ